MRIFKKKCNFNNIGHKCIIPSVWVAPEQMYNSAKYESSKSNHVGRKVNKEKKQNGCHFKISDLCTKYLMRIYGGGGGLCANVCKI